MKEDRTPVSPPSHNTYRNWVRRGNFRKAHQCLEESLSRSPENPDLLREMVYLCLLSGLSQRAHPWVARLAEVTHDWKDLVLLSQIEAGMGNFSEARAFLKKAIDLRLAQPIGQPKSERAADRLLAETESMIRYEEHHFNERRQGTRVRKAGERTRSPVRTRTAPARKTVVEAGKRRATAARSEVKRSTPENKPAPSPRQAGPSPVPVRPIEVPARPVPVTFQPWDGFSLKAFSEGPLASLETVRLLIEYTYLTIQGTFDELLCLSALKGVAHHWYQMEAVKKVLKYFHGRVLLCDEVGLGKTIEAGMLIKEYVMRGLARKVLVLTPPSLVSQWKEEMLSKFDMTFVTAEEAEYTKDPERFWENELIIASLHTAKGQANMTLITRQFFDIVVVDEAHHLRNRNTLSWKLLNKIEKRFIFLLTATPVQNNLIELYNLITLLKPGQFKTEKLYRREYLRKGSLRTPANKEKLRALLKDVMIRNTRSAIDVKLPRRFATTYRIEPNPTEKEIYDLLTRYLRTHDLKKPLINLLLREAESSPYALRSSLLALKNGGRSGEIDSITDRIDGLGGTSKGTALTDLLARASHEKVIIFTQYLKSLDYVAGLLSGKGIPHAVFRGDCTVREKEAAIQRFRDEVPVLVSTESGGEGRNIQFCNAIVNFDLPWNPMRLEQRIGRLHRIGQTRDVFVFNLSVRGTIEDHIIDILDNKINMFEMVIGEIEPILGVAGRDEDFEEIILEMWLASGSEQNLRDRFEALGANLVAAKQEYLKGKALDEEIFGHDYEI